MKKIVVAPLALAALLTACAREKTPVKAATPVRVAPAAAAAASRGDRYSATIQPHTQVAVAFRSSGYVDEVRRAGAHLLQAGDHVKKEDLLALVRQQDTAQHVAEARAALAEAVALAERAKSDAARAESLYAVKRLPRTDLDAARAATLANDARVANARASRLPCVSW